MAHKLLLILPAYNEEGKIGALVRKVRLKRNGGVVDEVVVATDGNTDNTVEEARQAGATVIAFPQKKGVGFAIRAGIDYALKNKFDLCCIMGGDNQDEPSEIPRLLDKLEQGYDFIIGSRYLPGGKVNNQPLFRLVTTKLYTWFVRLATFQMLTDASNGFRLFRTEICKQIDLSNPALDGYELENHFLVQAVMRFRWSEAPVTKTYHLHMSSSKQTPLRIWIAPLKGILKSRFGFY